METLLTWLDTERGRRLRLARELGIGPSAISQWHQVPTDRVAEVERLTGIDRSILRPDIFASARSEAKQ
ncbi:MAG: helix-turn-helix domain-containing protein [Devosia sp.]|nr:helix-turn-helix domain-containing protein [Devosia sp.]